MQLTILITGRNPIRHPAPQVAIPPITVVVPHPRKPSMFNIPETRKKVFAVCNSVGIVFRLFINAYVSLMDLFELYLNKKAINSDEKIASHI